MTQNQLSFREWLDGRVQRIAQTLDACLPMTAAVPARLHDAMRYAALGGGKRVRAALVYAAGRACRSGDHTAAIEDSLDRAAAAVELIHTYSLVHDDLPCMDNDSWRRGQPTVHVKYDEATALLVGDALQPLAFELLATMPIAPLQVVQAIQTLAPACGSLGMVGGQAIDLENVGCTLTRDELRLMHGMKTGALLVASVALGGIVAGASAEVKYMLHEYAQALGLAFQIVDDILDVTADSASLGKTAGKDAASNKPTYVSLLGLEQAHVLIHELRRSALQALAPLGEERSRLAELADFIVLRDR